MTEQEIEVLGGVREPLGGNEGRRSPHVAELIEAAQGRIQTVDFLDGFPLPPDNDELWEGNPRPDSGVTNSRVRANAIEMIAQGKAPLFMTWSQIEEHGHLFWPTPERSSLLRRARRYGAQLIESTLS